MKVLAELLQHLLHVKKQVQLKLVLNVVAMDVGVLEYVSALNNFSDGLLEEDELREGVPFDFV